MLYYYGSAGHVTHGAVQYGGTKHAPHFNQKYLEMTQNWRYQYFDTLVLMVPLLKRRA